MKRIATVLIFTFFTTHSYSQGSDDFSIFFISFSNDCIFQYSHVMDTVALLLYHDEEINNNEKFDTIKLFKNQWECIDFDQYDNYKKEIKDQIAIIYSRIVDTGVSLSFRFIFVEEKWFLCRIVDYSM